MMQVSAYPLKYTAEGYIFIAEDDDCDAVVTAMLASNYAEEFCIALEWDASFIARLMKAGFLIMSETLFLQTQAGAYTTLDLVLPKLHLVRSVLFFNNLHITRRVKPLLSRYELRFNTDFETIVHKCLAVHGSGWLTPSLVKTLFTLRTQATAARPSAAMRPAAAQPSAAAEDYPKPSDVPFPVSFALYRSGILQAGEFGIICGNVYTSYSGYKEEKNSGTVQMILLAQALEKAGFAFLDFGMPLAYKSALGALDVSPSDFTNLFRAAQ